MLVNTKKKKAKEELQFHYTKQKKARQDFYNK